MPQPSRQTQDGPRRRARGTRTTRASDVRMPSQRERLIQAMIELSARAGYQTASIAQVSSLAGVSSATFYEQFRDKEDCLLEAYRTVNEQSFDRMRLAMGSGDWAIATRDAFAELLNSVESEPSGARVQFIEARAGGPRLRGDRARARRVRSRRRIAPRSSPRRTHDPGCPGACAGGSGARPGRPAPTDSQRGPPAAAHR